MTFQHVQWGCFHSYVNCLFVCVGLEVQVMFLSSEVWESVIDDFSACSVGIIYSYIYVNCLFVCLCRTQGRDHSLWNHET